MKPSEETSFSLTQVERVGLNRLINLSDGHARFVEEEPALSVLDGARTLFLRAGRESQTEVERQFLASFAHLHGMSSFVSTVLSYSASCLAEVVGRCLGSGSRVLWPVPSFDNLRDLVATCGVKILPVPEDAVLDIAMDPAREGRFDAVWLTIPNNPTGWSLNAREYADLANRMSAAGKTLVIDHCFRGFSPGLATFDQYAALEASGVRYFGLEDTGKLLPLLDVKAGILRTSADYIAQVTRLNVDLLLNVSPFQLALLTDVMDLWRENGRIDSIRGTIAENRLILRKALEGGKINVLSKTSEVPFEWLQMSSPSAASDLVERCLEQNLAILPGGGFYSGIESIHCSNVRVALSRDTLVVRAGADVIRNVLSS